MNIRAIFFIIVCGFSTHLLNGMEQPDVPIDQSVVTPVVINDTLITTPYKIELYNLVPFTQNYVAKAKEKNIEDGIYALGYNHKKNSFYSLYKTADVLSIDEQNMPQVKVYHDRVAYPLRKRDNLRNKDNDAYLLLEEINNNVIDSWTHARYVQGLGYVPVIIKKETNKRIHDKANLFDMFSSEVDCYLLSHGNMEKIEHRSKEGETFLEDQISIFGSISITIDGCDFFSFGFFQYTFNNKGECYHRFFKPCTKICLTSLSNSETQKVLRNALRDFLREPEINAYFSQNAVTKNACVSVLNALQSLKIYDRI